MKDNLAALSTTSFRRPVPCFAHVSLIGGEFHNCWQPFYRKSRGVVFACRVAIANWANLFEDIPSSLGFMSGTEQCADFMPVRTDDYEKIKDILPSHNTK